MKQLTVKAKHRKIATALTIFSKSLTYCNLMNCSVLYQWFRRLEFPRNSQSLKVTGRVLYWSEHFQLHEGA